MSDHSGCFGFGEDENIQPAASVELSALTSPPSLVVPADKLRLAGLSVTFSSECGWMRGDTEGETCSGIPWNWSDANGGLLTSLADCEIRLCAHSFSSICQCLLVVALTH